MNTVRTKSVAVHSSRFWSNFATLEIYAETMSLEIHSVQHKLQTQHYTNYLICIWYYHPTWCTTQPSCLLFGLEYNRRVESCLGVVLDKNTYFFEQCEYNCDSSWSMNNHIDRNHRLHEEGNIDNIAITESSEDRFQCQECDSSFSYIFTLALHIKYCHTSDKVCCECNIG